MEDAALPSGGGGAGATSWSAADLCTPRALAQALFNIQESLQVVQLQVVRTGNAARLVALGLDVQRHRAASLRSRLAHVRRTLHSCACAALGAAPPPQENERKLVDAEVQLESGWEQEQSRPSSASPHEDDDLGEDGEQEELQLMEWRGLEPLVNGHPVSERRVPQGAEAPATSEAALQVALDVGGDSHALEASLQVVLDTEFIYKKDALAAWRLQSPRRVAEAALQVTLGASEPPRAVQAASTLCVPRRRATVVTCRPLPEPCVARLLPSVELRRRDALGMQLLKAAQEGRTAEVRRLLRQGADANCRNRSRWTPLLAAAHRARPDVVALLLQGGARANARNPYGYTALHMAAHTDHSGLCASFLLYEGAAVDCRSRCGRTPLHYAAAAGNEAVARALVRAGADRSATDDRGRTPLHVAKTFALQLMLHTGVTPPAHYADLPLPLEE